MFKNEKGNSKIALILIVAIVVVAGAIAVISIMNKDENSNIINNSNTNKQDTWGLKIDGKSITLPCTLDDLAKANVTIDEYKEKEILASVNKTFTMIPAIYGDS